LVSKKRRRGVYAPKAYRISKFYEILFDSCSTVLGKEKINLTYALIHNQKQIDVKIIKALPTYNKNELMELMIDQVRKDKRDIQALDYLFNHERIENIRKLIQDTSILQETPRELIMMRILPEYGEYLSEFKKKRSYAEALELVVSYFVVHQEECIYELIRTTYSYLADQELNKEKD
jgi:hypothetical protein